MPHTQPMLYDRTPLASPTLSIKGSNHLHGIYCSQFVNQELITFDLSVKLPSELFWPVYSWLMME